MLHGCTMMQQSAIRYLWAPGMGTTVLLLFIKCHLFQKVGSLVGFFFACLQRLSIWLRFFRLNFSLIINLFNFFRGFFNGLHTFLHV